VPDAPPAGSSTPPPDLIGVALGGPGVVDVDVPVAVVGEAALDHPVGGGADLGVVDGGAALEVGREVDTGVLTVKVTLPAVVTVDLRIVAPTSVQNGVTPTDHAYNEGARYASLKGIMAAKKKPIDQLSLSDLGVSATPAVKYSKFELPAARSGSVTYVENVQELVEKLRTQAKVL